MKKLFPGHYRPTDADFKKMWDQGLFVFDTNVLLNVYSYPDTLREIFLSILEKISDRSWIPYQVALEFHRNKLNRIKNSNKPLLDLRNKVRNASQVLEAEVRKIEFEKRNTGIGNLDEILTAMRESHAKLAEALELACNRLPSVSLEDPIGMRLSEIFHDRVGPPPRDQVALDLLTCDGSERYENKIPPGFADAKDKKDIVYRDRELKYQGMFGDLILWRQTINHIKETDQKNVIFITGDGKEDWFLNVDNKVIGPSPELIHELHEKTGVERFWVYRADQFLKNSETYLEVRDLTDEMVAQVKEASTQTIQEQPELVEEDVDLIFNNDIIEIKRRLSENFYKNKKITGDTEIFKFFDKYTDAYKSDSPSLFFKQVKKWARKNYPFSLSVQTNEADFALKVENKNHGFIVIPMNHWRTQILLKEIRHANNILDNGNLDEITLTVVLSDEEWHRRGEDKVEERITNLINKMDPEYSVSIILGLIYSDTFIPKFTLRHPKSLA